MVCELHRMDEQQGVQEHDQECEGTIEDSIQAMKIELLSCQMLIGELQSRLEMSDDELVERLQHYAEDAKALLESMTH